MIYLSQEGGQKLKNRIKQIRKDHKLTQVEFGERIGVKGNTITNYETGLRNPTDAVILAICREFGISKDWLLTGEGEMKIEDCKDNRYLSNVGKLQRADDETIMRWVNMIAETDPKTLKAVEEFMKKLLEIQED